MEADQPIERTSAATAKGGPVVRRSPMKLKMLAHHEVGHMIAALLLRLAVRDVTIRTDAVDASHVPVFEPLEPISPDDPEQECRWRAQTQDVVVAVWAGCAAEDQARGRGRSPERMADEDAAWDLMRDAGIDRAIYGDYQRDFLVARAQALIEANRSALFEAADRLVANGTVTVAELVDMLAKHPVDFEPDFEPDEDEDEGQSQPG